MFFFLSLKNSPILNLKKKSGANFELLKGIFFFLFPHIRSGSFKKIFTKEEKAENKRPSPNDGGTHTSSDEREKNTKNK
jgi:hypothetical protein